MWTTNTSAQEPSNAHQELCAYMDKLIQHYLGEAASCCEVNEMYVYWLYDSIPRRCADIIGMKWGWNWDNDINQQGNFRYVWKWCVCVYIYIYIRMYVYRHIPPYGHSVSINHDEPLDFRVPVVRVFCMGVSKIVRRPFKIGIYIASYEFMAGNRLYCEGLWFQGWFCWLYVEGVWDNDRNQQYI